MTTRRLTVLVLVLVLAILTIAGSVVAFASDNPQPYPGIIIWKNECPGAPDGWLETRTYNNKILVFCHVEWDKTESE